MDIKIGDIVNVLSGNKYIIIDIEKQDQFWGEIVEVKNYAAISNSINSKLKRVANTVRREREATPNEILKTIPKVKNEIMRERLKKLLKEKL